MNNLVKQKHESLVCESPSATHPSQRPMILDVVWFNDVTSPHNRYGPLKVMMTASREDADIHPVSRRSKIPIT